MAEPQVRPCKARIAGLHSGYSHFAGLIDHVPREDFFGQSHRSCGAGAPARGLNRRQKYFSLHARHVEREQPAVFDYLPRNLIFPGSELAERNFFAAANAVDQRKVRRGQQTEVLAILLVDALDILGNDNPNAGAHFRIRRLFAARSFAAPLAAHCAHKSATLHIAASDRRHVSALQTEVRNLAQRLVKVEAVVRRSDLVGRNIVAQLGIIRRILRVPRQVVARKLPFDEFGIFGEKQNTSLQTDLVRPLFDLAFQK